MGRLSEFIKQLFKQEEKARAEIPFLHEAIDIKSYPVSEMLRWQSSGQWDAVVQLVTKAYNNRLITGRPSTNPVALMSTSHSNGWLVKSRSLPQYTDRDYKHLAHYLYLQVAKQNYTLNLSEIRSRKKGTRIETITKYYLKPSLKSRFDHDGDPNKANQLYGNVTIEYKIIDGSPAEFKFMANAYQDHKFRPPYDFSELIDKVLT